MSQRAARPMVLRLRKTRDCMDVVSVTVRVYLVWCGREQAKEMARKLVFEALCVSVDFKLLAEVTT